jgi:hypothetical protein
MTGGGGEREKTLLGTIHNGGSNSCCLRLPIPSPNFEAQVRRLRQTALSCSPPALPAIRAHIDVVRKYLKSLADNG